MDYSALPIALARVHPLHWPVLFMNLLAVTVYLRANGIAGASLRVWPNGRVEITGLNETHQTSNDAQLQGLLALTGRHQQTASAALLANSAPAQPLPVTGDRLSADAIAPALTRARTGSNAAISALMAALKQALCAVRSTRDGRARDLRPGGFQPTRALRPP
ncbi:MAG: hypothetical protein AAF253_04825 [Pseudomonadota bacterium]